MVLVVLAAVAPSRADAAVVFGALTVPICPPEIEFGSTVACSIDAEGETDTYAFPGVAGDHMRARVMRTSGTVALQLEIHRDGTRICGPSVSGALTELVDCVLSAPGAYTLVVKGTGTGEYALHLQRLNSPVGCAGALTYGAAPVPGAIVDAPESECHTFVGATGERIRTRWARTSGTSVFSVEIFRPNGTRICGTLGFNAADGQLNCTLDVDGSYAVLVTAVSAPTSGYAINLQRFNPAVGCAGALTYGAVPIAGALAGPPETECHTFAGAPGERIRARWARTSGTAVFGMDIFRPDGTRICGTSGFNAGDGLLNCTLDAAGPHTVLVMAFGAAGGYALHLQRFNPPADCAGALTYGGPPVPGAIVNPPESECHRFDGAVADRIRLRWLRTSGDAVFGVEIFRPDGTRICGTFGFNAVNGQLNCTLDADGRHTALVFAAGGLQTGGYTLALECLVHPCGFGAFAVSDVTPDHGGDTGTVSVRVRGKGFAPGATVTLSKDGEDIAGDRVSVREDGRALTTIFDLTDAANGDWELSVRNPDEATVTAPQPFVVEAGEKPELWADIVGRPQLRAGIPTTYTVRLGNRGNVDAWGVHVFLGIPAGLEYVWIGDTAFRSEAEDTIIHSLVSHLGAGATRTRTLVLRAGALGARFEVGVAISEDSESFITESTAIVPSSAEQAQLAPEGGCGTEPELDGMILPGNPVPSGYVDYYSVTNLSTDFLDLGRHFGQAAIRINENRIAWSFPRSGVRDLLVGDHPFSELRFNDDHVATYVDPVSQAVYRVEHVFSIRPDVLLTGTELLNRLDAFRHLRFCDPSHGPCEEGTISCIGLVLALLYGDNWPKGLTDLSIPAGDGKFMADTADAVAYWQRQACDRDRDTLIQRLARRFLLFFLIDFWNANDFEHVIDVVQSRDPNEKVGAPGVGEGHFLGLGIPLTYEIEFENLASATAPAQEVVITDDLDAAIDPGSVDLGAISFAGREIVPPPGSSDFAGAVDVRPERNLLVLVTAGLEASGETVTWRLTAVDPDTGEPPEDPLAGFLPPNVQPPEGEGSVMFTALPQDGLATGAEIPNSASIVFDANPAIATGEWLNTLDGAPPSSRVDTLAATQPSPSFEVRWSGEDEGSGIRHYTVFVSEDGRAFVRWLSQTSATSATFAGRDGVGYRFHSVATDEVGNVEAAPAGPDAATRVSVTTTTSSFSEEQSGGHDESRERALENLRAPRRITLRRLKRRGIPLRLMIGAPHTRLTGVVAIVRTRARGRIRPETVARFQHTDLALGFRHVNVRLTRAGLRRVEKTGATRLEVRLAASATDAESVRVTRQVRLRR